MKKTYVLEFYPSGSITPACRKKLHAQGVSYCAKCKTVRPLTRFGVCNDFVTAYCDTCRGHRNPWSDVDFKD